MKALVVFESIYGSNQQIAQAVAEGLGPHLPVEVVEVGAAPSTIPDDVGLLVVGGPNHAMGMSSAKSRAQGAERAPDGPVSAGIGLREWFEILEVGGRPLPAVAWDTRLAKPGFMRWFDRASRGIEKRLRKRGCRLASSAEHFFVASPTGPLRDGEVERASQWAATLAAHAAAPAEAAG